MNAEQGRRLRNILSDLEGPVGDLLDEIIAAEREEAATEAYSKGYDDGQEDGYRAAEEDAK